MFISIACTCDFCHTQHFWLVLRCNRCRHELSFGSFFLFVFGFLFFFYLPWYMAVDRFLFYFGSLPLEANGTSVASMWCTSTWYMHACMHRRKYTCIMYSMCWERVFRLWIDCCLKCNPQFSVFLFLFLFVSFCSKGCFWARNISCLPSENIKTVFSVFHSLWVILTLLLIPCRQFNSTIEILYMKRSAIEMQSQRKTYRNLKVVW